MHKPLFGKAKLTIAGRDKSVLVEGIAKQVALVATFLSPMAAAPVYGALCFVKAELPLLGTLTFDGYPLLYPRGVAKRLNASGALTADEVDAVASLIAGHFVAA